MSSQTNIQIDVTGYYTSGDTSAGGYVALPAATIGSTTNGTGGLPKAQLATGGTDTVRVAGVGGVPTSASSVMLSIAETNQSKTQAGSLTPFPTGGTKPQVALSWGAGRTQQWTTPVKVGTNGSVNIQVVSGGPVNITVVVEGYFTKPSPGSNTSAFTPAQTRVYDSQALAKPILASSTQTVPVLGVNGVPTTGNGVSAVTINLGVSAPAHVTGHVQVFADRTSPDSSLMQFSGPATTSVAMTVPVAPDGGIDIQNSSNGAINVTVDVEGWYTLIDSTTCTADTVQLLNPQETGASQGDPVVSAVPVSPLGQEINGAVYLSGPGGGGGNTPIAQGQVDSGTSIVFHIPTTGLTVGQEYTWYITATTADSCANSATTVAQSFVLGAAPTIPTSLPGSQTLAITGVQLTAASAPTGTQACSGSACSLSQNTVSVGVDGNKSWVAVLKANLSGIPKGSTVNSAALQLTGSSCPTSGCAPVSVTVGEAASDVTTAKTGTDLAGLVSNASSMVTGTTSNPTTSWDISGMVLDWFGQGSSANMGVVLSGNSAKGSFVGPNAGVGSARIVVNYSPPTAPSAVTDLSVVPGDGGLLVVWADPANTGWNDPSGDTNGISDYAVTVSSASGGPVSFTNAATGQEESSEWVPQDSAVIKGLADGSAYRVQVVPVNPIGSGAAAVSASATPVAVAGGEGEYSTIVSQLLNASNALQAGTASSPVNAIPQGAKATVNAALNTGAAQSVAVYDNLTTSDQRDTDDTTSLSNTLAVPGPNGQVTLYTTTTETFTTVDTSSGAPESVPGSSTDDTAFLFTPGKNGPSITGQAEQDSLVAPLTVGIADSVSAPSSRTSAASNISTSALITTTQKTTSRTTVNLDGVAAWADRNVYGTTNGFAPDDCTDFVSRAIHNGGGRGEIVTPLSLIGKPGVRDNPNQWYYAKILGVPFYSKSWGDAPANYNFMVTHGGTRVTAMYPAMAHRSQQTAKAKRGEIIYANWQQGEGLSHAGIISKVTGNNIYIDQHSAPHRNEPLWKIGGSGWQSREPSLTVIVVNEANLY